MRLLIATDAFPPKCGGSGWSTFYLARALRARGHWVDIVMPKPGERGIRTRVYDNLPVTEFGYAVTNLPGLRAWQRNSALGTEFSAFLADRALEAEPDPRAAFAHDFRRGECRTHREGARGQHSARLLACVFVRNTVAGRARRFGRE